MEYTIFRIIKVIFKILPIILIFKNDRNDWIKKHGSNINIKKYNKHANSILHTFISLGPAYIKLGQWLSSRADILPQPYLSILSNLQDKIPPDPFYKIKSIIENEIGKNKFDYIFPHAISGASLAQAHLAKLHGKTVIIKVKRPGITKVVETDIEILKKILPIITKFVDSSIKKSMQSMLSQFIETIYEEMDYALESQNLYNIKKNLSDFSNVVIPNIYDDYSTTNIITMEYIPGIKITDKKKLNEYGVDRAKLVRNLHEIFFTMLLSHAIFHADPHPGNLAVKKDGTIIIYDHGMVGKLDNETRMLLVRLYLALVDRNISRTIDIMYKLGMLIPNFNRTLMEKSVDMSINSLYGKKPTENEINSLTNIVNKSMSKFPFILPKNLSLYIRMTSIIEGIYKTHNVDFEFVNILKNILIKEQLLPRAYIEELKNNLAKISRSLDSAISIIPELQKFLVEHNTDELTNRSNKFISNSIMISSTFIGSVFLYSMNETFGTIGFVISLVAGIIFFRK
ncbi:MAG: AarF/UbiB family protein [Thaumarchaeota archaeon]|nr:AarF/UbiB family protein [Nitrososphaerota archaeon]MCY3975957.1 AarF/UbiB family protein [Nitrososphaerota archaeon]